MIRYLLDTDHVSLHERGHPELGNRLTEVTFETIAVSVVTVEEMARGRLALLAKRSSGEKRVHAYRKFQETLHFFETVPVIPFDLACEETFQALRADGVRRIGSLDLRIAATALVHDLVMVTRNLRDFGQVPGVRIEDWTTPSRS